MTQVFSPFVPGVGQDGHHGYNLLYDNHPVDNYLDDSSDSTQKSLDKHDGKQQATFLTKLYALLERPEYHHMIRWDPKGEQIIVERPEQLALHVLPSIYRQSRFASFSRQLNIYGFMRKVNLRNVDPAIDDPDASTWSHPTLSRHSPPEVIANFKRRVPPRTPKARKRPDDGIAIPNKPALNKTASNQPQRPVLSRPRGLSASSIPSDPQRPTVQYSQPQHHQQPQSQPLQQSEHQPIAASPYALQPVTTPSLPYPQPQNSKWNHSYGRNALPPLTIPTFLPHSSYSAFPALGYSHNSSKPPLTPTDDSQYTPSVYQPSQPSVRGDSNSIFSGFSFSSSDPPSATTSPIGLNGGFGSSGFNTSGWSSYESQTQPPPLNPSPSNGTSSLSALLNPSNISSFNRPSPGQHTQPQGSYPSPFTSVPSNGGLARIGSGMPSSPDGSVSRPTTGYSSVSVSSMASSSYAPIQDYRPSSSNDGSGTLRRPKGRNDAPHGVQPYPSPSRRSERPVSAPDGAYETSSYDQRSVPRSGRTNSHSMLTDNSHHHQQAYSHSGSPSDHSSSQSPVALSPSATFAYSVSGVSDYAYSVPSNNSSHSSGIGELDGSALGAMSRMNVGGVVARMMGVPEESGAEGLAHFLHQSRPPSSSSQSHTV